MKIGSARIDEKGNISGGVSGDQTGREVAVEKFYVHKKGWNVFRAIKSSHRNRLSSAMKKYCADNNVGYDQGNRLSILSYTGKDKCECDCSSLVRRCIIDATGIDVGNFTTGTEKRTLIKSELFDFIGEYKDGMILEEGDILCSCTKGHTAIIVDVPVMNYSYQKGCSYFTTCKLYCRTAPDKTSKAVLIYPAGYRITVTDVKVVDGNIWVKTSKGWSAAIYEGKVRIK